MSQIKDKSCSDSGDSNLNASSRQGSTLVQGINQALIHAMEVDENVVILGEDIGRKGGVFGATAGLLEKFGDRRVMDTPIGEAMIAGISVGMATQGIRPIAEFQFLGFIFAALEQIACHASRMRNRTRGRLSCPIVFRAPYGAGIHGPEHHSESIETLFAHLPGLRVVVPSSPAMAYGLMLAAIRDADPVIFLEPKRIYRKLREVLPPANTTMPLDRCFVVREGHDVTIVAWGAMIQVALLAAERLQMFGVSVEVIDVATLKPIDFDTIFQSVTKTRRCVVVHEAARTLGLGSEISAEVTERAFSSLLAPIVRITGFDTVVPFYRLEEYYLPNAERVVQGVKKVLESSSSKHSISFKE